MWYQVDENALDDVRIKRLARRLGVSHGDAFLAVNRIWRLVYRRAEEGECLILDPEDVEAEGEVDDFANHLLQAGLAEAAPDGIRIKGDERAKKLAESNRKQGDRRRSKRTADEPRMNRGVTADEPRSTNGELAHVDATADEPRMNRGALELRRSSPTEKTGSGVESGSGDLFPSELPDPETVASSTPRARDPRPTVRPVPTKGRALPYTPGEVYAALSGAMGDLFSSQMPGGAEIHEGMAIGVIKALKQAAKAGYTLEDFASAGRRVAGLMRAKGMRSPVTPAWVAATDPDRSNLLRAVVQDKAGGARASPKQAGADDADDMADYARELAAQGR